MSITWRSKKMKRKVQEEEEITVEDG